jgi:hypothetical protein
LAAENSGLRIITDEPAPGLLGNVLSTDVEKYEISFYVEFLQFVFVSGTTVHDGRESRIFAESFYITHMTRVASLKL